jgi:hypothetical protein
MDLCTGDWMFINFASKNKDGYTAAGILFTETGTSASRPIQGVGNGWTKCLSGRYICGLKDLASNEHSQPHKVTQYTRFI